MKNNENEEEKLDNGVNEVENPKVFYLDLYSKRSLDYYKSFGEKIIKILIKT